MKKQNPKRTIPGKNVHEKSTSGPADKMPGTGGSKEECHIFGSEAIPSNSQEPMIPPNTELINWAKLHLRGIKVPESESSVLDLSHFDTDQRAALFILVQRLLLDGLADMPFWTPNPEDRNAERLSMGKAVAASPYRVVHTFQKLVDLMIYCVGLGRDSHNESYRKSGDIMANTLAGFVYSVQKHLEAPRKSANEFDTLPLLWEEPAFGARLQSMRRKKASTSPKRQFVEFIIKSAIEYPAVNARLNGKDLILHGLKWEFPKTSKQFTAMRPILQAESVKHLLVYAELCQEDSGLEGVAAQVRAMKTDKERNQFYHKSDFDEAFRIYLGLSKAKKKPVAATTKPKVKVTKASRKKSGAKKHSSA